MIDELWIKSVLLVDLALMLFQNLVLHILFCYIFLCITWKLKVLHDCSMRWFIYSECLFGWPMVNYKFVSVLNKAWATRHTLQIFLRRVFLQLIFNVNYSTIYTLWGLSYFEYYVNCLTNCLYVFYILFS